VLLQLLDDGRLTDSQGRTVDFTNTVVIMTSNIGSHIIAEAGSRESAIGNRQSEFTGRAGTPGSSTLDDQQTEQAVLAELRKHFRPEFLNRIDDVVMFKRLTQEQVRKIVDLQLKHIEDLLADRGLKLKVTDQAKGELANQGYDPQLGARPVKRVIQQKIQNALAMKLLGGQFKEGDTITVDQHEGFFTFQ
jgi:ATP-dependent Clp protease ATP-binding subunit ClpB